MIYRFLFLFVNYTVCMNIICIIDNHNGMLFNHRRLSQDHVLNQKILEISQYTTLRMSAYSEELFEPLSDNVIVSDDFLEDAEPGDICFVEDRSLKPYGNRIDTFYLFHWNRSYPSDLKLDFLPSENHFSLRKTEDFAGSSHDDITLEIWQKS